MGNYDVIRQREIQHMSAGSRIRHSEYNASDSARSTCTSDLDRTGKKLDCAGGVHTNFCA